MPLLVVATTDDCAEQNKPVTAVPVYKEGVDKEALMWGQQAITTRQAEKTKKY